MLKTIIAIAAVVSLSGCAFFGPKKEDQGRIEVQVVSHKIEVAEIDRSILDKCEKPQRLSKTLPGIESGKVMEKDLVAALVASYTNETNCYLVKEEALRLQKRINEAVEKANANGKDGK